MAILILVMGLILGLDQWTKHLVRAAMPVGGFENIRLFGDFFQITHIENKGIAFGLHFPGIQYVSYIAFLVIIYVLYKVVEKEQLSFSDRLSFAMIIAGATGNLIDRLLFGSVTDMILLGFHGYYFPVFNLADTMITTGIILYILSSGLLKIRYKHVAE